MDKNVELKNGGWQANVEYFKDYVIKTPKTEAEIREKIKKHYGSLLELERKINKLQEDWKNSIEIVKSGKIPLKLLAFPEFIEKGKIKQKRVKMLSEEFNELMLNNNLTGAKKIVDKVIDFILLLWTYGLHERTFKFYTEMGLLKNRIVLVDIGELTDKKEVVREQLLKGDKKLEKLRHLHNDKVLDYYQEQIKNRLTVKTLDKIWASKIK